MEVFTLLADGPRSASNLAETLGVAEERLSRLLHALVVSGLLEKREDGFANTEEAAEFLVKGRSGYLGGIHELLSQLWHADPLTSQSIRSGKPAAPHDFAAAADEEMAAMLRGMHPSAVAAGRDLARRFDFSTCGSVIDIGGGSGGLIAALREANAELHGTLFDLPRTTALAASILTGTPGSERVSVETGDILLTPPREMHDGAVMRALVQVLSPADAARTIANTASAVRCGGVVYIVGGGILNDDRLSPSAAVFGNLTFMNLYPAGAAYTVAEHAAWLSTAGCGESQRITLPNGAGIVRATKLH